MSAELCPKCCSVVYRHSTWKGTRLYDRGGGVHCCICGIKVQVDSSVPETEVQLRDSRIGEVKGRITNLKTAVKE